MNNETDSALEKDIQEQKKLQETILDPTQLLSEIKKSIQYQTQLLKKAGTDDQTQKSSFADALIDVLWSLRGFQTFSQCLSSTAGYFL